MRARATIRPRQDLCEVDMSPIEPNSTRPPVVSDEQLVLIVYLLYFAAYIFGITALIGVIIAYVRFPDANPLLRSHYQFQIRTFWIGLLYLVVGAVLAVAVFPVIGVAILTWWLIWSLVRNVKGLLALNDNKPIQDPTSWMFG
jgi:uncharacterized membrane protein